MSAMAAVDVTSYRLKEGEFIGRRYQIRSPLGRGTFAEVYAARDFDLGRDVAIKVFAPGVTLPLAQREVQFQARFQHERIMPLLEAGWDEQRGVQFAVMPLYRGDTLENILQKKGVVSWRKCVSCADQSLGALEFIRQQGAWHGDLKPSNIFMTEDWVPFVMDFSLCRLVRGDEHLRAGTPGYVAPEAQRGEGDTRADIFALGVVMYRMLTGRKPFQTNEAACTLTPPPPSQLRPETPAWLDAIVMRALEKDPNKRFRTPNEMRWAMRRAEAEAEAESAQRAEGEPVVVHAASGGAAVNEDTIPFSPPVPVMTPAHGWQRRWAAMRDFYAQYPAVAGCLTALAAVGLAVLAVMVAVLWQLGDYLWREHRLPFLTVSFAVAVIVFVACGSVVLRPTRPRQEVSPVIRRVSSWLLRAQTTLLSLLVPGLGQWVNGERKKALVFTAAQMGYCVFVWTPLLRTGYSREQQWAGGLTAVTVWALSVVDAATRARSLRRNLSTDLIATHGAQGVGVTALLTCLTLYALPVPLPLLEQRPVPLMPMLPIATAVALGPLTGTATGAGAVLLRAVLHGSEVSVTLCRLMTLTAACAFAGILGRHGKVRAMGATWAVAAPLIVDLLIWGAPRSWDYVGRVSTDVSSAARLGAQWLGALVLLPLLGWMRRLLSDETGWRTP